MPAPRMSIGSLVAQLQLEKRRACVVTEGISDRRLLEGYANAHELAVDIYCTDDIDIVLDQRFKKYGGAKGRVITLMANNEVSEYADKNAAGLVDRDLDEALDQIVDIKGVYYSQYACLPSYLFSSISISSWMNIVFGKTFSENAVREIEKYILQKYRIRVVKAKLFDGSSLPSIKNYVNSSIQGGFDWKSYVRAFANGTRGAATEDEVLSAMESIQGNREQRFNVHFHSVIEFLYFFGRKERIIDNSVSIEEMNRNVALLYVLERNKCGTAKWLHRFVSNVTRG